MADTPDLVVVLWNVFTVAEFNTSCLVDEFGLAPADVGLVVVGTAECPDGRDLVVVGPCPLWRSPESIIEEEYSPQMDALLDEAWGPLHSKTVHHG